MKSLQAMPKVETTLILPDILDELGGHETHENQGPIAPQINIDEEGGHLQRDNQMTAAPSLLNIYVQTFEQAQHLRLETMNRMRCWARDSIPKDQWPNENPEKSFNDIAILNSTILPLDLRDFVQHIVGLEKDAAKMMKREMKQHPLWPFLESIRGMGPVLAARLLHRIDGKEFKQVSNLWSYCGLDGPGWRKNPHNWDLTSICFNIAESFQKQSKGSGGYRDIYDARKEYEDTKPPCEKCKEQGFEEKCRPAHINNKARRYAVKMFLKDLWVEMQGHSRRDNHIRGALH